MYDKTGFLVMTKYSGFFVETGDSTCNFQKVLKKIDKKTFWVDNINPKQRLAFEKIAAKVTVERQEAGEQFIIQDTLYVIVSTSSDN